MAATSWRLRHRKLHSSNLPRSRYYNREDDVGININDDPAKNIALILSALCQTNDITDGKRLNYLNAFVKVTLHIEGSFENVGYSVREIFNCLRITLVHESTQVRSGGLRAIRHVLRNEQDIIELNNSLAPFLIARSMDLILRPNVERMEAMKVIRKILLLSPENFHEALGRSLIALANVEVEEKDKMVKICLATLCELAVMNAQLFIHIGGVAALTRNLLENHTARCTECMCGVLLLLLDKPITRNQAAIDLYSVAAPYCDFHYRHSWKSKDKFVDEREIRFQCSKLALLSILKSWPGVLHFCNPQNKSGLKALVEVLYLNQLEVRKAILDLLYELLGLPQPEWTDELSVALNKVDPAGPQYCWRLSEGFVAAEGQYILPHLAKTTPSISDMHLALLLYCFLECGLLRALVEVIATSDTFISVRATVLLGELLHLMQILLPPECCDVSPPLPTLLEYAAYGKPQAAKAVNGLQELQKLLRSRPASSSLHLDFILRSGDNVKSNKTRKKGRHRLRNLRARIQQFVSTTDDIIKESGVLLNKDAYSWNWNVIREILKDGSNKLDLVDSSHKNFLKRLVDYYTPSNKRYSQMDLSNLKTSSAYALTGIDLINCLMDIGDQECFKLINQLFEDIADNLAAITMEKSVHDCLFNPQHMGNSQCQSYFLFIGQLSLTENGLSLLSTLGVFESMEYLVSNINNDCYVKLIISSMDYSNPGPAVKILKASLDCPIEATRLYATRFLLVLLRAGINGFSDWGVKLLVSRLNDDSRVIQLSALTTLQEACELPDCLETLITLDPDLSHLGDKGCLLKIRFLSLVTGFQLLNRDDFIMREINKWNKQFNLRYVKLVESEISDALSLHQKEEDGKYNRRNNVSKPVGRKEVFVLPHLYGQLARHSEGALVLMRDGNLETMLECLETASCDSDEEIFRMKSALWAVGHFGSAHDGLMYLLLHNGLAIIIGLAQHSLVFSIRATAYYVLGLIATTREGADELFKLGWFCTRHNRHISWPIIEEESWDEEMDDSLRIHCGIPNPNRSSDLYFFDSGIKDIEESTTDDDISVSNVMFDTNNEVVGQQKSLTLPANQSLSSAHHKRSLSESKTFEMVRSPLADPKLRDRASFRLGADLARRNRNNSTTDSTTSGVSSCESACGGRSIIYERQPHLSPIPSACSISSTLKTPGQKIRRHSESSRRISVQSGSNSDRSSHSMAGSFPYKLSHQDLVGYTTLRSLKRGPRYLDEPQYMTHDAEVKISWDLPASAADELSSLDVSFASLSTVKKSSGSDLEGQESCYMGIALPENIDCLFPEPQPEEKNISFGAFNEFLINTVEFGSLDEEKIWKHDVELCIECSVKKEKNYEVYIKISDPFHDETLLTSYDQNCQDSIIKSKVLHFIDRFSNPVWCKQVKQSLLLCKQRNPQLFGDLCLYSEVYKLISTNSYRLSPRRMLHELFGELNYKELYQQTAKLLLVKTDTLELTNTPNLFPGGSLENGEDDESETDLVRTQSTIRDLEQLRLTYKENKFPIKSRKEWS